MNSDPREAIGNMNFGVFIQKYYHYCTYVHVKAHPVINTYIIPFFKSGRHSVDFIFPNAFWRAH